MKDSETDQKDDIHIQLFGGAHIGVSFFIRYSNFQLKIATLSPIIKYFISPSCAKKLTGGENE